MDPSDLVGEEGAEMMDVEEQEAETAVAVVAPAVGPELVESGALETLVVGVFEKVAVGVLTSVVQSEVKELMVRFYLSYRYCLEEKRN